MICERCGTVFCWDDADAGALGGARKRYCSAVCNRKSQAGAKAKRARYDRLRRHRPKPCPTPRKPPYSGPAQAATAAAGRRNLRKDSPLWPYECRCGAWHLSSIPVSAEHAAVVEARIAAHPDGARALRILGRKGLLPSQRRLVSY